MYNPHGERLTYHCGQQTFSGYLNVDRAAGSERRPGILVVHEAFGITEQTQRCTDRLAALGYVALAVDMYGNGNIATSVDQAMGWMQPLLDDMPEIVRRFDAAKAQLQAHPKVDPSRIGAIGYCFGGSVVLYMARIGQALGAVVSFHGGLGPSTPPAPVPIEAKVLVCTGEADPFVPHDDLLGFGTAMRAAGADFEIASYPGAMHSFTNPEATALGERYGMPLAYDQAADTDSWQRMQRLFESAFAVA